MKALRWFALIFVLAVGGLIAWRHRLPSVVDASPCTGLLGRPLRVGIVTWPGYAAGIVANNGFKPNQDCIFYEYKHRHLCVEFELIEASDALKTAFELGGSDPNGVDIAWSTVDSLAYQLPDFLKSEIRARAIMQVDWSRGGDAIVADDAIKSFAELYQKKISLTLHAPSHWLLEYALQNSGLEDSKQNEIVKALPQVQSAKYASPDARDEFLARRVDATVVWEPDVTKAHEGRKSRVLLSTSQARNLIADVMMAKEHFIREHPDVIQAFVEAWLLEGEVAASRDPGLVVKLLRENEKEGYQDLSDKLVLKSLASVRLADLSDNVEMFNLDGGDQEALFDRLFDLAGKSWARRGYVTSSVSPASLARDDRFLRRIYYQQQPRVERIEPPKLQPGAKANPSILVRSLYLDLQEASRSLDLADRRVIDDEIGLLPEVFSESYIRLAGDTKSARAVAEYLAKKYHFPESRFLVSDSGSDGPGKGARSRRIEVGVVSP